MLSVLSVAVFLTGLSVVLFGGDYAITKDKHLDWLAGAGDLDGGLGLVLIELGDPTLILCQLGSLPGITPLGDLFPPLR